MASFTYPFSPLLPTSVRSRAVVQQQPQQATPLKVWTANVKYLQMDWKRLLRRMAEHERNPDVVFMQEVKAHDADRFRRALARWFDSGYGMRWVEGDNAVVWKAARLDLANSNTSTDADRNALRWKSWGHDGCDRRDRGQLALRLWDRADARTVVAASVRWTHTTAFECMGRNVATLNRKIEDRWSKRDLTIVAGDFNSVADRRTRPGDASKDLIEAGTENDPECWYRNFSAVDTNQLANDRPGQLGRDCTADKYYRSAADTYYDSIGIAQKQIDSTAICRAWTHVRKDKARRGNACTDKNSDGLRDMSRLDYIWVRWENATGKPLSLTAGEADALFGRADADSSCIDAGCLDTRYSDHRAAFATIN
jgi:hypothetical protein